jgi:ATP-binding cassette subfamily C protein/ATP-binding cassette subfamily C protein EexD
MVLRHGAMDLFGPRAEVLKRLMTARPAEVPAHSSSRLEGTAA